MEPGIAGGSRCSRQKASQSFLGLWRPSSSGSRPLDPDRQDKMLRGKAGTNNPTSELNGPTRGHANPKDADSRQNHGSSRAPSPNLAAQAQFSSEKWAEMQPAVGPLLVRPGHGPRPLTPRLEELGGLTRITTPVGPFASIVSNFFLFLLLDLPARSLLNSGKMRILSWGFTISCILSFAGICVAQSQCFVPNGQAAAGNFPCDPTATHSACCDTGSTCLTNKLCRGPNGNIIRGTCTDKNWESPECAYYCMSRLTKLLHLDTAASR